jgi:hypothetical protein
MRLIIEPSDFRKLSPATQQELIGLLTGKAAARARPTKARSDRPMDMNLRVARELMRGLTDDQRRRLKLFADNDGRVGMQEMLAVTGDQDWHVISQFQGVVTRRLRRIIMDTDKNAFLIGWDYDSTKWDKEKKHIVDGVYYVTRKTAQALKTYFNET